MSNAFFLLRDRRQTTDQVKDVLDQIGVVKDAAMGPHRPDLVESHPPAWTPVTADGLHYGCVLRRETGNLCLRSSATGLLWPSYTTRGASHTLRIHPQYWYGPGQTCPRTQNSAVSLSVYGEEQQRASENMTRVHVSSSWSCFFLTGLWEPVLQGVITHANSSISKEEAYTKHQSSFIPLLQIHKRGSLLCQEANNVF